MVRFQVLSIGDVTCNIIIILSSYTSSLQYDRMRSIVLLVHILCNMYVYHWLQIALNVSVILMHMSMHTSEEKKSHDD